ncbi:hypothetical protein ARMGADRAFT_1006278 [Armillaria gallica]|uniref:Uncharacterized protein n=1 Tax=Armillaria gallica TaxID=47427 RepID=A0A2H3DFM6_ARMGA|nr:hypothetical protein ARMGADRAFT_1012174 [Armillaria gallica]PBL02964.1 hypothetical protein ARMGADRAFT_1006278 [Armillaria gallica]
MSKGSTSNHHHEYFIPRYFFILNTPFRSNSSLTLNTVLVAMSQLCLTWQSSLFSQHCTISTIARVPPCQGRCH